jgi:hypothetical protein
MDVVEVQRHIGNAAIGAVPFVENLFPDFVTGERGPLILDA